MIRLRGVACEHSRVLPTVLLWRISFARQSSHASLECLVYEARQSSHASLEYLVYEARRQRLLFEARLR